MVLRSWMAAAMVAVAGTSVASAVNPGVMLGLSNPGLDYARSILVSCVDAIARPSTLIHCICMCRGAKVALTLSTHSHATGSTSAHGLA